MDFLHSPHKNLVISSLVALTIVGVGFFANRAPQINDGSQKLADNDSAERNSNNIDTRDSDNDGLPDWEENLYRSNIYVPDTDGDGTTDGDEVAQGRNPVKAGPDDRLAFIQDPDFATSSTDVEGKRKEFFTKFLALQSDKIRETTYRDLITGFNPKKYRPTDELVDLNVTGDNSAEALRAYGNMFGMIIKKYTSGNTNRTEEEILADGLKVKNDEALKELQLLTIIYKQFSTDLKTMATPSSLAKSHLRIVNGYDGMSRGLTGMQHLFSDPIDGAGAYETYTKNRLDVTLGYGEVVGILSKSGVIFANNEPGYPFTRVLHDTAVSTSTIQ